jgi:hypothetical protein
VARCHGLIVASLAFKLKHLKSQYLTLLFEGFKHFDYLPLALDGLRVYAVGCKLPVSNHEQSIILRYLFAS